MRVITCCFHLPRHTHHLKGAVWNKQELRLVLHDGVFDEIDMQTLFDRVNADDEEHRGEHSGKLSTRAKVVLSPLSVFGCGEEHWDSVELARGEEAWERKSINSLNVLYIPIVPHTLMFIWHPSSSIEAKILWPNNEPTVPRHT